MQTINYDAIVKNARYFKSILGDAKLCAVLKNDAYGHGLQHVARYLAGVVDCFAVGSVEEACQIAFLDKDVLLLLPQNLRNTEIALQAHCILTVDSFDTLNTVDAVAHKLNTCARVHVKFDSGMSRLGFTLEQIPMLKERLQTANVTVEGVFSHFYGDSEVDCDKQLAYFERCYSSFCPNSNGLVKHIANTSATLLSPRYHLDMARVGLGLFGYGSSALRAAKSVYADVIAVKKVSAGSVVGYGAKYVCNTDTKIAVLNVGYATGFARTLVGSRVQIGNKRHKVEAICMAMTLVDVGDAEVHVGDVATLLDADVNISNDQVIIYELLCNLR